MLTASTSLVNVFLSELTILMASASDIQNVGMASQKTTELRHVVPNFAKTRRERYVNVHLDWLSDVPENLP